VMFLSVIFLAAETPRYRAPLDPFVVLLAAIAITRRGADEPHDVGLSTTRIAR
jgi:hypothetical protein